MSASSPTQGPPVEVAAEAAGDLLAVLGALPDPRPGGWRRHPLGFVLGVLAGPFASAGFGSFAGAA